MPKVSKTTVLQYLCNNMSRRMLRMKLIFCLLINIKGFFEMILSFLVYVGRLAHITQNNKFPVSLQHLKKEVSDAVDLSHANKHESLLQFDTVISMEMAKYSRSSQISKFTVSLQYLKKNVQMKLTFYMQINIKVPYKLISTLGASKFSTR